MGLFNGIKNTYKKSEAAVVVQNLLEHQASFGLFDHDPARFANQLVQRAWDSKPDIFAGKFGQRPHKLSTAAIALALGYRLMSESDRNRDALLISLGIILADLKKNAMLYPFNGVDEHLLERAVAVYQEAAEELGVEESA